jgi:hypothetical protein
MPYLASASSRQPVPDDETISLREILEMFKDRGVTSDTLTWLRKNFFIPRPTVRSLGDAGTVSNYPATAVPVVHRYFELSEAADRGEVPRNKDDWLWRMRFEKLAVDIRGWGLQRLDEAHKLLTDPAAVLAKDRKLQADPDAFAAALAEIQKLQADPAALAANLESRAQNRLMRIVRSRIHKIDERVEGFRWALAVVRGEKPEVSLYDRDIEPSPLTVVLKIGGLSLRLPPPDLDFRVEESSIARLREILREATDAHMGRALNDLAKFDTGLATIPLAGLNRHARRALAAQHATVTQDTIAFFRELWRRYDARAVFLATSIEWSGRGSATKRPHP